MIFSLKNITDYSLILCLVVLPFSNALMNIAFALLAVLITINLIKNKVSFKLDISTIAFTILCLYLMINGLFQGSYNANKTLWKFIPLLSIGYILLCNYSFNNIQLIKKISITTCIAFVVISMVNAVIFYSNYGYFPFGNGDQITEILFIHRPYLGLYIVINLILLLDIIVNNVNDKYKYLLPLVFVFLSSYLVIISARLSILSLIILGCIYILFYTKTNIRKKLTYSSILVIFISGFTILNPNFTDRIKPESIEQFKDYEPRFVIWESVNTIVKNPDYNTLIGYGNYKLIEEYLVINYSNKIESDSKREFYISEKFNTHSQFLDYLLFGGFIGFLLFTSYNIITIYNCRKNFTAVAIAIAFFLFFIVENVFHRQLGSYLFLIYMVIFTNQIKSRFYHLKTS